MEYVSKFGLMVVVLTQFAMVNAHATTPPATPGVVPISGLDASLPDQELRVLDPMLKGAEIVSIGESVHGSGGFVKMQLRLVKYMVQRKGFRLLMIENPIIRSKGMTDWLDSDSCATTAMPIDLLDQPIEEDRALFNWLCSFNQAHPQDKVRFRGMDIWDRPWDWQTSMQALNQELSLGQEALLSTTFDHCWFHKETSWDNYLPMMHILSVNKKIPEEDYIPCTTSLDSIRTTLHQEYEKTRKFDRKKRLLRFMQSVDSAEGYQKDFNFAYQDRGLSWDGRDLAQSQNELHIWLEEGRKKAMIITHTSHASKDQSPSDWWKMGLGKIHSGVSFLRQTLGNKVRAIGLTGYEVTGVQGDFLKPTSDQSLDVLLHGQGHTVAYVDPYSSFMTAQDRWWIENENSTDGYPDGVYMIPKDNFDALFFVDQSLKGTPILPWRDVWMW
jgi:erythromycin esterase-like protein